MKVLHAKTDQDTNATELKWYEPIWVKQWM